MVTHLRKKIEPQTSAINNLILLEQFLNAVNLPVICEHLARVVLPDLSRSFISHYPLCISVQWLGVLALLNRSFGSLGIAVFRVVYVKAQSLILNYGEFLIMKIIAGTGSSISIILTTWHIMENYLLWDTKMLILCQFCMDMKPKIYEQHAIIDQVGLFVALVANIAEFTCYFLLFTHMHRYDIRMHIFKGAMVTFQSFLQLQHDVCCKGFEDQCPPKQATEKCYYSCGTLHYLNFQDFRVLHTDCTSLFLQTR